MWSMNISLTPEQQNMIERQLESGRFRSAEEVIAEALQQLREQSCVHPSGKAQAVREMLEFIEKNRVRLRGISVKELLQEGRSI